jgi:hypothetical protein
LSGGTRKAAAGHLTQIIQEWFALYDRRSTQFGAMPPFLLGRLQANIEPEGRDVDLFLAL